MHFDSIGTPGLWIGFFLIITAALVIDLGVFQRRPHEIRLREALYLSLAWIALSLVFNIGVYYLFGTESALAFFTGYLVEKALSVDNIFVFVVLFGYFGVPPKYQHRVLMFGIIGAVLMRGFFIVVGVVLVQAFEWLTILLGMLLIYAGYKLLRDKQSKVQPDKNILYRLAKRWCRMVPEYRGARFLVIDAGKLAATPLFLVLVAIEATDLVFAADSIPAILAISRDPFIVFTSNIFAILGLRALYFLVAGAMKEFDFLRLGLAVILVFIGLKMMLHDFYPISIGISLAVISAILVISVVASLMKKDVKRLAKRLF